MKGRITYVTLTENKRASVDGRLLTLYRIEEK